MELKKLLEVLACPKCKGKIELRNEKWIICKRCRLKFPIEYGVPNMLLDSAEKF